MWYSVSHARKRYNLRGFSAACMERATRAHERVRHVSVWDRWDRCVEYKVIGTGSPRTRIWNYS